MTFRIALWPVSIFVVGLLSTGACSGSEELAGPQVLERDGVTTLVLAEVPKDELSGDDALVVGVLSQTENGCLAVSTETGSQYVLAWPPGTELLTGDETGVRIPDVGELLMGQELSAAGGFHAPPRGDRMPEVPGRCLATEDDDVAIITDPSTINI